MSAIDHTKLYKTQISQSEWLSAVGHDQAEAFRLEDNEKRERLRRLNEIIGIPYDKPYQFSAVQVEDRTAEFSDFLAEHGDELCAMRLIPLVPGLPKLRTRGASIKDSLGWYKDQGVDPAQYRVDFVPHPASQRWASIFVVNQHGVYGEMVYGSHAQLTQGFYESYPPIQFSWDFSTWKTRPYNPDAEDHLKTIMQHLLAEDPGVRSQLATELGADFAHNYVTGYFETTDSPEAGLWFIDYNRILGHMYRDFRGNQPATSVTGDVLLRGQTGSAGRATGPVRLVHTPDDAFEDGAILVCAMTTPDYLPLMQRAGGIITDMGGVLSHAAIVARELGKPCLTATRSATSTLVDGQMIELDADAGVVRAAR